ncbi:MAG: hypothetical protein WED10_13815 [Brumimicrobium sp.]
MKTYTLLFALLFFVISPTFSQEVEEPDNHVLSKKNHLGVNMGSTTGMGLSYKYFGRKLGVQITGIPVFQGNGYYFVSTGVTALYRIKTSDHIDLVSYLGNHMIFSRTNGYQSANVQPFGPSTTVYPVDPEATVESTHYNIGLGAGVDIHLSRFLDMSIKAGYGLYDLNHGSNAYTSIALEFGMYYRF